MNFDARHRWEHTLRDDYYLFLDESGNYHFAPNGTPYLIYTAVSSGQIHSGIAELFALKHLIVASGIDLEYFHASEDRQIVRDAVFREITKLPIRIDSIIVDKRKTGPSLRPIERLYPRVCETMLGYLFRGLQAQPRRVHVFFDTPGKKINHRAVTKGIKQALMPWARQAPFTYSVLMHDSKSHPYLQIADYCGWALSRKYQQHDYRSYKFIMGLMANEFEIFGQGLTKWY